VSQPTTETIVQRRPRHELSLSTPPGPTADADGLEVFQLLTIPAPNRRHIFKIAAVCCVLALAFTLVSSMRFESTARVYLGELESRNAASVRSNDELDLRAPATATPQPSSRFSTAET